MTAIAAIVGATLGLCHAASKITARRRTTVPARVVRAPVAAGVCEPEPFWFPEPPACSLDEAREVLVHVAPAYADDVAEVLEFPVGKGWDVQSIATVIAEIESL